MEIYPITPTASQIAWTDYIPVRFNSSQYIENTTDNEGYMAVNVLSSTTGKQAWVDYVPVVIDSNRTDAWQISANGYIPVNYSGTGDGTAANKGLSLNFLGADRLDPRITFSRASNATVTNSSGNIVYAPHNLLTFSEQFDNSAWVKNNSVTVAANNTSAPDGTVTADTFTTGALISSGVYRFPTVTSGAQHTLSVYIKNNSGATDIRFGCDATPTNACVRFNAVTGTITSSEANVTSSAVTNVGNGWYRVSVTYTSTSTTSGIVIYGMTGTVVSFHVWGAQLNVGSLQSYNPTTVKNLLGFSEQFDNAAWTKSNSFIQTNFVVQSEIFTSGYTLTGVTATADTTLSPRNTNTADTITETSATSQHILFKGTDLAAVTSGISYTFSVYAKPNGRNFVQIFADSSRFGSNAWANFNISTGAVGFVGASSTATITDAGNGWYRCTMTCAATSTGNASQMQISLIDVDTNSRAPSYAGNATLGIFIWGAQLVQGSVAGDYQQTTSSALAVMYQDPNGTMTADKLVENTATGNHLIQSANVTVVSGTSYTISTYAKAGERSQLRVALSAVEFANGRSALFNLANGTVTAVETGTTAEVISIGNGWYRCSVKATASASGSNPVTYQLGNGATSFLPQSYTGDGTSGIYIWGAQLSDSASLDQYVNNPVAAPSSTAFYGARFDYDPVTLQPRGLLIEEQRSNLQIRSEEFNTSWVPSAATISADATTAPSGLVTADKLAEDNTNAWHYVAFFSNTPVASTAYTLSVFAKKAEREFVQLYLPSGSFGDTNAGNGAVFNLTTGTIATQGSSLTSATITSVGNGWYRCSITKTATNTNTYPFVVTVRDTSAFSITGYQGVTGNGIFIWGAQLEAGAFPTSYIPTTTAQVTRSADVALIQGSNFSSWYNPNTSTIFTNVFVPFDTSSIPVGFTPTTGDFNNSVYLTNTPTADVWQVFVGGVAQASITVGVTGARKSAATIALNDFALCANGGTVGTDTSGTFASFNRLTIGCSPWNTDNHLNGYIRQIAYYPTRLQNSQLQAITS